MYYEKYRKLFVLLAALALAVCTACAQVQVSGDRAAGDSASSGNTSSNRISSDETLSDDTSSGDMSSGDASSDVTDGDMASSNMTSSSDTSSNDISSNDTSSAHTPEAPDSGNPAPGNPTPTASPRPTLPPLPSIPPVPTAPPMPSIAPRPTAVSAPTPVPTPRIQPSSIDFPAYDEKTPIVPVGMDKKNNMATISKPDVATWYRYGATPGDAQGNAILAGHVRWKGRRGDFALLHDIKLGDSVIITLDNGEKLEFTVVSNDTFKLNDVPDWVMDLRGEGRLTLITCAGEFDQGLGTSNSRTVVVCKLLS